MFKLFRYLCVFKYINTIYFILLSLFFICCIIFDVSEVFHYSGWIRIYLINPLLLYVLGDMDTQIPHPLGSRVDAFFSKFPGVDSVKSKIKLPMAVCFRVGGWHTISFQ